MILRNLDHPEVKRTNYRAHGGGSAHMLLTHPRLQTMMFLAHASVPPGEKLEGQIDPMEEIYIIVSGRGRMQEDDDIRPAGPGDVIHIPIGAFHELVNDGDEELAIHVVAGLIPGEM
jgi:mannose-6-phosphate isomerase-like protein (cupin superfamily)